MSEDEYKAITERMRKCVELEGPGCRIPDHVELHALELKIADFLRNRQCCQIRFCHNSVFEFGLCEKHYLIQDQLFKEMYARMGEMKLTVLEQPVSWTLERTNHVGYGWHKGYKKQTPKKSYSPKPEPAPVIVTAAVANAAVDRLAALKAKMAGMKK